jgi:hypothetical protein
VLSGACLIGLTRAGLMVGAQDRGGVLEAARIETIRSRHWRCERVLGSLFVMGDY